VAEAHVGHGEEENQGGDVFAWAEADDEVRDGCGQERMDPLRGDEGGREGGREGWWGGRVRGRHLNVYES
jgi:hypothetical protein